MGSIKMKLQFFYSNYKLGQMAQSMTHDVEKMCMDDVEEELRLAKLRLVKLRKVGATATMIKLAEEETKKYETMILSMDKRMND